MTFASFEFLGVFLPIALVGHVLLRRHRPGAAGLWLVLASFVFYGLASAAFLPLLAASIAGNYLVARRLTAATAAAARRRWLGIGLTANLLALAGFKYAGFVVANVAAVTGLDLVAPELGFPLGISFFTLQQVVFLVDCAEGLATPGTLRDHALFQAFFPYVTSGPIVRQRDVRPALGPTPAAPTGDDLALGLYVFALGLFKKAVLADNLGLVADAGFDADGALSTSAAWLASVAYTLQLYFDFSGYSDMAIALGLWFGWRLPQNFDSPLRATSVIDFWRRWHITLSNLITTYLYTPLMRLRERPRFGYAMVVTVVAMTIAGLWHGPAWTYVAFGLAHGLGLVANQLWKKRKRKLPRLLAWALTFTFVNVTFVIFRADSLAAAGAIVRALFVPDAGTGAGAFATFGLIERAKLGLIGLAALAIGFGADNTGRRAARFQPSWRSLALVVVAALVALLFLNGVSTRGFLYRDF